jgi:hypothetical protein
MKYAKQHLFILNYYQSIICKILRITLEQKIQYKYEKLLGNII